MSRPIKKGLNYFPLDVDFLRERKIQRLILMYGTDGIAVFIGVLCEIYMTNGYYLAANDAVYFDLGFSLRLGEERIKMIVGYCVEIGLFDAESFDSARIITSAGIQERYVSVCKQLKRRIDTTFLILDEEEINAVKTLVFSALTGVSSGENPTKEKKGKEKKEKENKKEKKKTKKETNYENERIGSDAADLSSDAGAAARQRELIEMARQAAASDRHA